MTTPLIRAYDNDRYEAMELLLINGANPNVMYKTSKYHILMLAIIKDKEISVELLLRYGAYTDYAYTDIRTFDHWAIYTTLYKTPFLMAYHGNNQRIVDLLFEYDMNIPERIGELPILYHAALNNKTATIDNLIARGADPNMIIDGEHALIDAVKNRKLDGVSSLLHIGAKPNVRDDGDGMTPLYHAVMMGHIDIMNLLLIYKADPNVMDKRGTTPLYFACMYSDIAIIKALLDNGADYNAACSAGNLPLSDAIGYRGKDIHDLLDQYKIAHHGYHTDRAPLDIQPISIDDDKCNMDIDGDLDVSTSYDDTDIRTLRIELRQLKIMLHKMEDKINSYSSKSLGISSSTT